MNGELEKAGRVADYFEIGKLMCYDALTRKESCGAHFREEYQTRMVKHLEMILNFSLFLPGAGKESSKNRNW